MRLFKEGPREDGIVFYHVPTEANLEADTFFFPEMLGGRHLKIGC